MKNALHFVGFKNPALDRWKDPRAWNAIKVFGHPDFWHAKWDFRAREEMMEGDWAVFADGNEHSPIDPFGFDDSAFQ